MSRISVRRRRKRLPTEMVRRRRIGDLVTQTPGMMLIGAGIGALLMYLFDQSTGSHRRTSSRFYDDQRHSTAPLRPLHFHQGSVFRIHVDQDSADIISTVLKEAGKLCHLVRPAFLVGTDTHVCVPLPRTV
jgi:hypothetical protein